MSTYLYKGYKISNLGYHQPDHCVWWEAVDKNGCACFHGNTLREVEMLINDSEWEDKLKVKDAEITDLKAKNTEAFKAVLKRDALIKKLTDALDFTYGVIFKNYAYDEEDIVSVESALNKVREVVGNNRVIADAEQDGEDKE